MLRRPSLTPSCTWQLQRASFQLCGCPVSGRTGQRGGRDASGGGSAQATYDPELLIWQQIICGCTIIRFAQSWFKQRQQTWHDPEQRPPSLQLAVGGLTNMLLRQSLSIRICPNTNEESLKNWLWLGLDPLLKLEHYFPKFNFIQRLRKRIWENSPNLPSSDILCY